MASSLSGCEPVPAALCQIPRLPPIVLSRPKFQTLQIKPIKLAIAHQNRGVVRINGLVLDLLSDGRDLVVDEGRCHLHVVLNNPANVLQVTKNELYQAMLINYAGLKV